MPLDGPRWKESESPRAVQLRWLRRYVGCVVWVALYNIGASLARVAVARKVITGPG